MFDTSPSHRSAARPGRPARQVDPAALAALRERARPVSTSRTQLLPVLAPLRGLLPEGGIRRGSTVAVTAGGCGGATTLALALMAAASTAGSWSGAVGLPGLGAAAVGELGCDLARFAFVPRPGAQWADTVAALLEGVDMVLLRPPPHPRAGVVRRLVARVRDRRAVLLLLPGGDWPEGCDTRLRVETARWVAVGRGEDCLRQRLATVTSDGRRSASRPLHHQLWLPDASLSVAMA